MTELARQGVRQARYRLAQALVREGVRVAGAVEQLDAALNEPGDDPPKWELLQLSARALREVNPADAAARYLRSFQYRAPDSIAREACQWVGSLPLGVLRLNPGATTT